MENKNYFQALINTVFRRLMIGIKSTFALLILIALILSIIFLLGMVLYMFDVGKVLGSDFIKTHFSYQIMSLGTLAFVGFGFITAIVLGIHSIFKWMVSVHKEAVIQVEKEKEQ